jgi:hypothetical protein
MTQYKVINASEADVLEEKLNEAASEGFDLVTAFPFGTGYIAAVLVKGGAATPAAAGSGGPTAKKKKG